MYILTDAPRKHRLNHGRRKPAIHPGHGPVPPNLPVGVEHLAWHEAGSLWLPICVNFNMINAVIKCRIAYWLLHTLKDTLKKTEKLWTSSLNHLLWNQKYSRCLRIGDIANSKPSRKCYPHITFVKTTWCT